MRQALVEADDGGDLGRMPAREVQVRFFKHRRAAAEQDKLQVRAEHFFERAEFNVHALLVRQARDAAEKRDFFAQRQPKLPLQFELVLRFSRQIAQGIRVREKRIARRVPFVVIHAVQNSKQRRLAAAQNIIQPTAKFRRRDLAGVARTDRRDDVAI